MCFFLLIRSYCGPRSTEFVFLSQGPPFFFHFKCVGEWELFISCTFLLHQIVLQDQSLSLVRYSERIYKAMKGISTFYNRENLKIRDEDVKERGQYWILRTINTEQALKCILITIYKCSLVYHMI